MVTLGLLGGSGEPMPQLRALLSGTSRMRPNLWPGQPQRFLTFYPEYPGTEVSRHFTLGTQTQSPSWGFEAHLFRSPTRGGISPPTSTPHAEG